MADATKIVESGRDLFTQTRFRSFRDCPRRHYLRFELGIDKQEVAQPLRMGRAYHLGQELLSPIPSDLSEEERKGAQEKAILSAVVDYNEAPPSYVKPIDWAVERETVARMLQGYAWRWGSEPMEIVEAEVPFKVPLTKIGTDQQIYRFIHNVKTLPPERVAQFLAGVIDKIVRLPDGRLAILEHKTTSDGIKPGSRYWKQRNCDQQTAFYFNCARKLNIPVQAIIYDVIRKPGIQPSTLTQDEFRKFVGIPKKKDADVDPKLRHHYFGEKCEIKFEGKIEENGDWEIRSLMVDGHPAEIVQSGKKRVIRETPTMYGARLIDDLFNRPEMYFAREEIELTDNDLDDLEADVSMYHQMILLSQTAGRWPKNTDRCYDFGNCNYVPICSTNMDPTKTIPDGMAALQFVHPELAERINDDDDPSS